MAGNLPLPPHHVTHEVTQKLCARAILSLGSLGKLIL